MASNGDIGLLKKFPTAMIGLTDEYLHPNGKSPNYTHRFRRSEAEVLNRRSLIKDSPTLDFL